MSKKIKAAVFGLGSMGYGMAGSLLRAGHQVYGKDINADAVERFQAEGGETDDLTAVAQQLDAVVIRSAECQPDRICPCLAMTASSSI